jgi:hypothetical protein
MPKGTPPKSLASDFPQRSIAALVACALVIFVTTVLALSGSMWIEVLYRLLVEGSVASLWLLAMVGIGRFVLFPLHLRAQSRSLQIATAGAAGIGVTSLVLLALGLAGVLNRPIAIALVAIGVIGFAVEIIRNRNQHRGTSVSANWAWLIIVPVIAMVLVSAFVLPGILWGDEPHGYDVLEYHLQVPREWYELGRIVPLRHNVFSYFPFNVEMHYLLAMYLRGGPWAGMYLAQLMHVLMMALAVLAVYGIVIEQTADRKMAACSAVLMASIPWTAMLAPVAYDEGGLILFSTLAIGWALIAMKDGSQRHRRMLLAGAMAGFACGVKLTAVPMILIAVPICLALAQILRKHTPSPCTQGEGRGEGRSGGEFHETDVPPEVRIPSTGETPVSPIGWLGSAIAFIIAGVLTFSPWLIRNQVWAGNPVFPELMPLLGHAHFAPVQVQRWEHAHAAAPSQQDLNGRVLATWNELFFSWRYAMFCLPVLAIAAILLTWRKATTHFLIMLLGAHLLIWIFATHLQGRFFVLSIPITALLVAQVRQAQWRPLVYVTSLIAMAISCAMLAPRIARYAPLIGMSDYRPLLAETVLKPDDSRRVLDQTGPLLLVGDARAFMYDIPSSRLTYRTVFDIAETGKWPNLIIAWIGRMPDESDAVIVGFSELNRFAQTYWGIPKLEEIRDGSPWGAINQPIVITAGMDNARWQRWRDVPVSR